MSEQSKIERPYQDGSWHWVKYEGLHKEYGAPAMYKSNCDAWYSFEFSGIPTRQVEVLGPCVNASQPVGAPSILDFADEVKQLCKDFSDLQNRPYMGDVTAAIDGLYEQFMQSDAMLAAPTVKAEQVPDPSLPAAGSAGEEVKKLRAMLEKAKGVLDEVWDFSYEHSAASALNARDMAEEIVAALSAQQSAPERVRVPRDACQWPLEVGVEAQQKAADVGCERTDCLHDGLQAMLAELARHAEGGKV